MTVSMTRSTTVVALSVLTFAAPTRGFAFIPAACRHVSKTSLGMGLFDGAKESFEAGAPAAMEKGSDRETPIDRWFGWNTKSEEEIKKTEAADPLSAANFVDTMDAANYVTVEVTKPMGIVFEENDGEKFGGIFVASLVEGGNAETSGALKEGDQLVAVGTTKVSGLPFDDAFSAITDSPEDTVKLTLFRGNAKLFYGATGPSQDWLDQFISS